MFGLVLQRELTLAGRRSRFALFRRLWTGWLVFQFVWMFLAWWVETEWRHVLGRGAPFFGDYAESLLQALLFQQALLMIGVTPAYTAGALTEEKTSGTLQYLLTTGLCTWEIVVGKLLGRTAHVAMLALAGVPFLGFLSVFTGIEAGLLLLFLAALAMPLLAAGAAGLLASVWCRSTRDAVLVVYTLGLLAVGLARLLGWHTAFDPFAVLTPDRGVGPLLRSGAAWGGLGLAFLGLAAWRLRPAYVRQLEAGAGRAGPRWWRPARPPVGDQPLVWKERHVEGLAPFGGLRAVPRTFGLTLVFVATLAAFLFVLWDCRRPGIQPMDLLHHLAVMDLDGLHARFAMAGKAFAVPNVLMIVLASLVVAARASGTVTGERERQTWEGLLLSPLTARQLLRGKLWGILGSSYPYLAAYAVPATLVALVGGYWPAVLTLGAVGAAFLAMVVLGAVGVWCSVRSKSSWRSLLGTLFVGFSTAAACHGIFLAAVGIVFALLRLLLLWFDLQYRTTTAQWLTSQGEFFVLMSYAALVGVFAVLPWVFLRNAEKQVAIRERVRRWPSRRWKRSEAAGW